MERYGLFVLHLEYFLKCKISLNGSDYIFMQKGCLTVIDI